MSITFSHMVKRREEMWGLVGGAMGGCVRTTFLVVMCIGSGFRRALVLLSSE